MIETRLALIAASVGAVLVRIEITASSADAKQAENVQAVLRAYIGDLLKRADGMIEQRRQGA